MYVPSLLQSYARFEAWCRHLQRHIGKHSTDSPHACAPVVRVRSMQGLLAGVLDRNKHVQEAACSALATLEEAAGPDLEGRLQV